MKRIKSFFVSEKTIITLVSLILCSILTAAFFPQRFITSRQAIERWQHDHPFWDIFYQRLGLDHVYTTIWFALLLGLFLISLAFSLFSQFKIAYERSRARTSSPASGHQEFQGTQEELLAVLKKSGYSKTHDDGINLNSIKYPWGYWGNFFLHLGIFLVIGASLLISITQRRGSVHLVEGEIFKPGDAWLAEEKGLLAKGLVLPGPIRLEKTRFEFWENHEIRQIYSDVTFLSPKPKEKTLSVSSKLSYEGITIYQSLDFGHAFFLEFSDPSGNKRGEIFMFKHPESIEQPSYENFSIKGEPYTIKAKYYVDAEKRSIEDSNFLLVLRLMEGDFVIDQKSLLVGGSASLGPYQVRLVKVSKWAGMFFAEMSGMPGIFLGFFVIVAGSLLHYFLPPREIMAKKTGNIYFIYYKASRFSDFYEEEFDEIREILKRIGS